jgi:hypothetical protein
MGRMHQIQQCPQCLLWRALISPVRPGHHSNTGQTHRRPRPAAAPPPPGVGPSASRHGNLTWTAPCAAASVRAAGKRRAAQLWMQMLTGRVDGQAGVLMAGVDSPLVAVPAESTHALIEGFRTPCLDRTRSGVRTSPPHRWRLTQDETGETFRSGHGRGREGRAVMAECDRRGTRRGDHGAAGSAFVVAIPDPHPAADRRDSEHHGGGHGILR